MALVKTLSLVSVSVLFALPVAAGPAVTPAASPTPPVDRTNETVVLTAPRDELDQVIRQCQQSKTQDECLQSQFHEQVNKHLSIHDKLNREIRTAPQQAWSDGAVVDILSGHLKSFYGMLTTEVGRKTLHDEDIDLDVNKRGYEDQMTDQPGEWVQHWLRVDPRMGIGFQSHKIGLFETSRKEVNLGIDRDFIIRVTKRHTTEGSFVADEARIEKEGGAKFWQNSRLLFALPTTQASLKSYHPGESLEIERYSEYHFETGPFVRLISEDLAGMLVPGVAAYAGVQVSHIRNHFRTTAEILLDGNVRVTLERIKQRTVGFKTALGFGFVGGIVDYVKNIANFETSHAIVKDVILDLVFDLKNPKAQDALSEAYRGNFIPAEDLARDSFNGVDSGVRLTVKQAARTDHHKKTSSFVFWGKSKDQINRAEHTQYYGDNGKIAVYENRIAEIRKDARSPGDAKRLDATTVTDAVRPEAGGAFSFRFDQRQKNVSKDVMNQFLSFAEVFGAADTPPLVSQWRASSLNGAFSGHLVVALDPEATAQLFAASHSGDQPIVSAWAKFAGLADPAKFAAMSRDERKSLLKDNEELKKHYENLEQFEKAITAASRVSGKLEQAKEFVQILGKMNYDLLPAVAAGTLLDRSHMRAYFRIQVLAHDAQPAYLSFVNRGNDFHPVVGSLKDDFY